MQKLFKSVLATGLFTAFFHMLVAQPSMYVHETNSTQTVFPLDSIRKLTFPAGVMQVHRNAGDTVSFSFANIRYVDFNGLTTQVESNGNTPTIGLQLYCNSNCEELHVVWNTNNSTNAIVEILDIEGRVVVSQFVGDLSLRGPVSVSLLGFSPGVYFCRVLSDGLVDCERFLKY